MAMQLTAQSHSAPSMPHQTAYFPFCFSSIVFSIPENATIVLFFSPIIDNIDDCVNFLPNICFVRISLPLQFIVSKNHQQTY
jgi:hypothetical protein